MQAIKVERSSQDEIRATLLVRVCGLGHGAKREQNPPNWRLARPNVILGSVLSCNPRPGEKPGLAGHLGVRRLGGPGGCSIKQACSARFSPSSSVSHVLSWSARVTEVPQMTEKGYTSSRWPTPKGRTAPVSDQHLASRLARYGLMGPHGDNPHRSGGKSWGP